MKRLLACALAIAALAAPAAHAREYPDLFATPKGRAMGGALTAITDDHNALFYNPAGLAYVDEWSLRLPEIVHVHVSPGALDFYDQIRSFEGGSSTADIAEALKQFDGKGLGIGFDFFNIGWFRKRFGIAFNPASINGSFRIRVPSVLFAKVQTRITADTGLSIGYGHPLLDNHLRVGVTLRPFLMRGGADREFVGAEIQGIKPSEILGFGWGSDLDLGVQGNLDSFELWGFRLQPFAGAVLQNALGTRFEKRVSSKVEKAPPPLERRVNAGIGAKIGGLGALTPAIAIEARDLLIDVDDPLEYLHAGVELGFRPRRWFQAFLRGHFAKGNVGGGIGGRLWAAELEVGTYAVNLGKGPGIGRDRRTYVSLATHW